MRSCQKGSSFCGSKCKILQQGYRCTAQTRSQKLSPRGSRLGREQGEARASTGVPRTKRGATCFKLEVDPTVSRMGTGALQRFPPTSVTLIPTLIPRGSCIIEGAVAFQGGWLHRQQMLSFQITQSWRAVLFLICFLGNLFHRFSVPSRLFQCI